MAIASTCVARDMCSTDEWPQISIGGSLAPRTRATHTGSIYRNTVLATLGGTALLTCPQVVSDASSWGGRASGLSILAPRTRNSKILSYQYPILPLQFFLECMGVFDFGTKSDAKLYR